MTNRDVIIACDFSSAEETFRFLDLFKNEARKPFLKIGMELFYAEGPEIVREIKRRGHRIFLDLKLHDIPNTVANGLKSLLSLDPVPAIINVHVPAGGVALEQAAEVFSGLNGERPWLIGVTVLTSMGADDLAEIGMTGTPEDVVKRLASLTQSAGLDGVVCSAQEAAILKETCGSSFKLITPGVRPAGSAQDDQTRVMTPEKAIESGADYLVIGRPITQADDPVAALAAINATING